MDYQCFTSVSPEDNYRDSPSSRRRSVRRSADLNNFNEKRLGMKMKKYLSPKTCWRETTKMEKIGVCFVLLLFFTGIYVTQSTLTKWKNSIRSSSSSMPVENNDDIRDNLYQNIQINDAPISFNCDRELFDIKLQINELLRIKQSVLNELRGLEEKRSVVRTEISILLTQSDKLQNELQQGVKDLEKIISSIEQAKMAHKEAVERNMPEIYAPLKLNHLPDSITNVVYSNVSFHSCNMHNCFDYSRCSFFSGFTVNTVGFGSYKNFRRDAISPCIVFINDSYLINNLKTETKSSFMKEDYNQILLQSGELELLTGNPNGKRIIAGTTFLSENFRPNFDFVIPPITKLSADSSKNDNYWLNLPRLVPARRKYLLSFVGSRKPLQTNDETKFLIETLNLMKQTKTKDNFYINFTCASSQQQSSTNFEGDWLMCHNETQRIDVLKLSTFSLIIAPDKHISSLSAQKRFEEALKYGAIPVILGKLALPFEEMIDWKKATVILPKPRVSELHFFLRTFLDFDILQLRQNGRLFWEKYFRNTEKILDSVLAVVRHRLQMPAEPFAEKESATYFNKTFQPVTADAGPQQNLLEADEYLGPVELPYPSPKYQQNFSLVNMHSYESWNIYANPFELHQFNPFRVNMPSEAKFEGSQFGFRPINNGAGGSGKEFSEALGGNFPREQFTVVLLTYEREQVLLAALARLNHLPYLNKIIVVWNGPTPPTADGVWPKTSAPVIVNVIFLKKNSLNNRFLYFSEIETEAVLSMDDDVHLRHDEIVFGFRVWREARDRIVGFPGRFHGWDAGGRHWVYNSNHSCELSMVLTGAAFVHKYYFHLYSNEMPLAIRDKVDELMNCEDIAINFLVSHITKKPPVKVTSRWTFRCPGCPDTLSADDSHFNERHECINFFTQIYGYNPLLYTQFRVDSVLFKTKIPHNHQKCFKFI